MSADSEDPDWPLELEWLSEPVELLRFDVAGDNQRRLRLFFNLVGDDPPGKTLSEVKVIEAGERVSVLLLRRELEGTLPNGHEYGSKRISCLSCVQVELRWPLDTREVIDATTGRVVERLDRAPQFDPEQGSLDHQLAVLAQDQGCPLWRSA